MIVLDASVAIELVLNTPTGRRVADRLRPPEIAIEAPHLIDLEVLQVLRRLERVGVVDSNRASDALRLFSELAIVRHAHEDLVPRIWALRANLTAYDAAYVALAEVLGVPLLTCDRKLQKAAHSARIEVVE